MNLESRRLRSTAPAALNRSIPTSSEIPNNTGFPQGFFSLA